MSRGRAWLPVLLLFLVVPLIAADGGTALREAAREGDLATLKRLVEEGVDVDAANPYGATALAYACDKGHLEVVEFLVAAGADVNTKDSFYEFTPLGWSLFEEHDEIVKVLIDAGARGADQVLMTGVRRNDKDLVALALTSDEVNAEHLTQALELAMQIDGSEKIVALLEAADAKPVEREEVIVDPSVLESYVGRYRNDELKMVLTITLKDGVLIGETGSRPLALRPLSDSKFEAIETPQMRVTFSGRGGIVERANIEHGPSNMTFRRVGAEEEAEAETAAKPAPAEIVRTAPQNWPSFRGPQASGIADGQGAVTDWNLESGHNVRWKTPIPGLANSSPIVWGDRVFVTSALSGAGDETFRSGLYGDVASVDDTSEHEFKVYALDRDSGKIVWQKTAAKRIPGAKRHLKATQANSTPVTDGKHVVALFGTIGLLVCYDLDGNEKWRTDIGVLDAGWFYDESYQWGHSSSPIIHDGLVIVQADLYRDSFVAAWKLADGKPAWRTSRDGPPSWGSPTVYRGEKRDELITNGSTIRGYDPASGKELWSLGPNSEVTVATPIVGHGLIYVTAGYPPARPVYAIRPGGSGDISLGEGSDSSEAIAWSKNRGGTYIPTPIVYGDYLYTCANDGRLTCYDAKSGEQVYRARVGGGGTFSASPIAADGKLYFSNEEGEVIVVRAGGEYEELAKSEMDEVIMSTPAISSGVMIVRTLKHVYGIGAAPETSGN